MTKKNEDRNYDLMSKNSDNWKGIFYVNRKDPRIIVPKINPKLGWTLNFGHIYSYLGLIVIVAIVVAAQYLL